MKCTANKVTFDAIGTEWTIESDIKMGKAEWLAVVDKIKERIERFDKTYSRFRDDSLVAKVSRSAGTYLFPDDGELLFNFYRQLYDATDGKVTPLVGDLLVEAGYDASYSLRPQSKLHPVAKWNEIITYKYPHLTVRKPLILDFGAAGKGYIIDIIGELMTELGVDSFVIDAGGDILRRTDSPDTINVGLGHPVDETQAIGIFKLGNGSICGSAVNRRQWAGLHHIMDPDAAEPVRNIIASWAVADTALLADGMATALFLTDPIELQRTFTFEYCIVRHDATYERSADFPAELFTEVIDEPR